MTTETKKFKKVRLFKLSKELNVSLDSILEHLEEAGYDDVLAGKGLNASLTDEDAYLDLQEAFATDRAAAERIRERKAARRAALAEAEQTDEEGAVEAPEAGSDEIEAPAEVVEVVPETPPAPAPTPIEAPVAETILDEVLEAPAETPAPETVEPVAEATVEEAVIVEEAVPEAPILVEEPAATSEPEPVPEAPPAEAAPAAEATPAAEVPPAEAAPVAQAAPAADPVSSTEDAPATETPDTEAAGAGDVVDEESLLTADRYQLTGTTVIGKIDLKTIDDDGSRRKRKRKRKRKGGDEKEAPTTKRVAVDKDRDTGKKGKRKRKKGPKVDQEEVQQTLQDTLRELEQGASRARQRRRRARRDERAAEREREARQMEEEETVLRVTEYLSTGELANLMDVPVTEVISTLFSAGMIVSINQRLDADTISIVADEYGYEIEFISEFGEDDLEIEEDDPEDLASRAPVVTVMGHVDHGKTSLLDYIREAKVVEGESGGITQHIGAYHVEVRDGKNITFLDTPGHEAFTAMRARGAQVTDVVILVVAADDSVMPQTIEAINHAGAAEVPIIVAINKMDKPDANPQKVMAELAEHNVLVEQFGGSVQCAQVSAHTGDGIDDLLDKVLLEAELLELKANPERNALGVVIESRLDRGRGVVATVLVENGTLRVGDTFVGGIYNGRVRAMFDERDRRVEEVGPSHPALILGFTGSPDVGDRLVVLEEEREARDVAAKRQQIYREQSLRQRKHITLDEIGRRLALGDFQELNLIVKGDVGGSVEALSDSLMKLSKEEVAVNIIHSGVGAINESDVMLASASDAVIIGFQVRPVHTARTLAEREEIDIRTYSIIYQVIEDVKAALEGLLSPEEKERTLGTAEVRETFKVPKIGTIAGCMVVEGRINRNDKVRLIREGVVIYTGNLASLKRFKDDVREVQNGYECGMGIENYDDIKVGDSIEAFETYEKKRTLDF